MAWRPNHLLTEGALAFSDDGRVKGVLHFHGLDRPVKLDLTGCPADLRGRRVSFRSTQAREDASAAEYMAPFALLQRGEFEAFLVESDQVTLAWNSGANKRVCVEFAGEVAFAPVVGA